MAIRLNQLNQQPLPLRINVGCLGRPRGRTDERRRRSALSHGPRKLDRSHGRRGRDVYKYYTCFVLHGRTEEPGYPPSTKLLEPVRRMQLGASETTNAITESDGLRTMGIMS